MALLTVILCLSFSIFLYWECYKGDAFHFCICRLTLGPAMTKNNNINNSNIIMIMMMFRCLRCTWEQTLPATGRPWMEILVVLPPGPPGASGAGEGALCMQSPGKPAGSFHGRDSWDNRWLQEHCKQNPQTVPWDPPASTRNYQLSAGITGWNFMLAVMLM